MDNNYVVIMAGGIGSRFWPLSRETYPKQFIDILGTGESLIQQSFRRAKKICSIKNIMIVTNKEYKHLCIEQLEGVMPSNILCEPVMRNTAPCIAYASFKIHSANPNANIVIVASDHIIMDDLKFFSVINDCLEQTAINDIILTLGISPNKPETGYGYIQFTSENLNSHDKIKKVKTFTEKPNQELALNFIDSGDFLWNSGMFICNANSIILAFRKHLRDLFDIFEEGRRYYNTDQETNYINSIFSSCKNISIDYGIMERSDKVYVYPTNFGWSDLGTWSSLYTHSAKDLNNNVLEGENIYTYNSENNIIKFPKNKLVVIQGLSGYIIVESNSELLICKKEDEQDIKQFVLDIKKNSKKEINKD